MTDPRHEQERRDAFKRQLDEDLNAVRFRAHEDVLRRTHPSTPKARLAALWNRELEIAVRPAGIAAGLSAILLLFALPYAVNLPKENDKPPELRRELIQEGGSLYWKDLYEKAVNEHDR